MTSSTSHQAGVVDMAVDGDASQQAATPSSGGGPPPPPSSSALQQAEAMSAAAKSKYEQRIFSDAMTLYSKAIAIAPSVPTYYLNRAATHYMLGSYADAVADCTTALACDPTSTTVLVKAHRRMSKCHVERGEYAKARDVLQSASAADASAAHELRSDLAVASQMAEWQAEGEAAMGQGEYSVARAFFANTLQKTNAPRTRLSLCRAELALGLCDPVLRTCRELIKADGNAVEAYVLRAVALLYSHDLEQARKHLREALRLDPDHPEGARTLKLVRKLEGFLDTAKSAYNRRDFAGARDAYTAAMEAANLPQHAPLSATMHAERGACQLRLREYEHALRDATVALYAQDDCKSAWVTKAAALQALGRHEQAIRELEPIMQTLGNDAQISGAYNRAVFEVRRARRPDYYGLLQVPSIASALEIKGAYKARALECHPDRMSDASAEQKAHAEASFKLLGEALEMLTDDFKRKLWDEGYDKEAIEERVRAAERAAREEPRGHHHHHHH